MRYITLDPLEEQTIRELVNNHANSHIRNRGQSILLSHLGLDVKKMLKHFQFAHVPYTHGLTITSLQVSWD